VFDIFSSPAWKTLSNTSAYKDDIVQIDGKISTVHSVYVILTVVLADVVSVIGPLIFVKNKVVV